MNNERGVYMNKIMLIGNLTKDPELRATRDGVSVCTFRIAVNKRKKGSQGEELPPMYYRVTTWRQLAENCGKYLIKGCKVYTEGDLSVDEFVGNDGEKRFSLEVNADNVEFLSSKADVDRLKAGNDNPIEKPVEYQHQVRMTEVQIPQDELPF